jgi:tetratricopeptide (TPR) repeat protein
MGLSNYAKAVEMYKQALQINAKDNDIHKFLSNAYSSENDTEDALNEYNTYIKNKDNSTANDYMSLAENLFQRCKQSAKTYRQNKISAKSRLCLYGYCFKIPGIQGL